MKLINIVVSDKPGLEFCLTGYENPGLQLPESVITYVAVRGMPEFMINLRAACLKLRERQNPRYTVYFKKHFSILKLMNAFK